MIENIPANDLIVLDLFSESRPQWGDSSSNGIGKMDSENMTGYIACCSIMEEMLGYTVKCLM